MGDEYGFPYHLERDLVEVFDKANLAAFVKQIRARFDDGAERDAKSEAPFKDRRNHVRRRDHGVGAPRAPVSSACKRRARGSTSPPDGREADVFALIGLKRFDDDNPPTNLWMAHDA